eukprot:347384-Chlamydomonas_euryale.AAC.5
MACLRQQRRFLRPQSHRLDGQRSSPWHASEGLPTRPCHTRHTCITCRTGGATRRINRMGRQAETIHRTGTQKASRQTDRRSQQAGMLTGEHASRQTERMACRLVGRPTRQHA